MLLLFSVVSLLQDPLSVRADSVRPRHDALSYEVALTLPDSGSRIHAAVTTRWRLTSAEPIRIDLDTVFTVARITVDGRDVDWRRSGFPALRPSRCRKRRRGTHRGGLRRNSD